jgi:hypothetical protein
LLPNVLPTINPREDEKHPLLAPPKHGKSAVVALLKAHDFKSPRTMGSVGCVLTGFVLIFDVYLLAGHSEIEIYCVLPNYERVVHFTLIVCTKIIEEF